MARHDCPGGHFARRDFLRIGSLSFLGIHLSDFLAVRARAAAAGKLDNKAKAESVVLVWLEGGPPHMDTWDPKPSSGFKPISTSANGIQISELFPKTARQMDKLAIIRSMHTEENNHVQAHHEILTGHRPSPAMRFPSVGAIIAKEKGARGAIPPHVLVPGTGSALASWLPAQMLGAQYDPLVLPDPNKGQAGGIGTVGKDIEQFNVADLTIPKGITSERVESRAAFLSRIDRTYRGHIQRAEYDSMDKFREQAWNMILSPAVRAAFDLSAEPPKLRDAYGRNALGQSLLLARRLVEAGSRFVTADGYRQSAWDIHRDNDKTMASDLGPTLDYSLAAFMEDLHQRGLLESTIVIVTGEFGRTPEVNPNAGRDHWCFCWSMLLGGGGIKGGTVVGASDARGAYPEDRPVSIGDVYATIYKAMGIDWTKEYMHPSGRPLKIANATGDTTGQPITELL
jgi:hypothetical protein